MKTLKYLVFALVLAISCLLTSLSVTPEANAQAGKMGIMRCQQIKLYNVMKFDDFTKKIEKERYPPIVNRCESIEAICYYIRNGHQLACIKK